MWADLFGCDSNVSMPSAEFNKGPPLRQLSRSGYNCNKENNSEQNRVLGDAEHDFSSFVSAIARTQPDFTKGSGELMEMGIMGYVGLQYFVYASDDEIVDDQDAICYDPILSANLKQKQQSFRFGDAILQPLGPRYCESFQQHYFAPISPNNSFVTPYHSGHSAPRNERPKKRFRPDFSGEGKSTPRVGKRKRKLNFAKPFPNKLTPEERVQRRQKQISLGKKTEEYKLYIQHVPKGKRRPDHPETPDAFAQSSKRAFDRSVRTWRRALHTWRQTECDGLVNS